MAILERIRKRLGQKGFTLLDTMLAASLLAFILGAYLSLDSVSKKMNRRVNVVDTVEGIRGNIISLLGNAEAVGQTILATQALHPTSTTSTQLNCLATLYNHYKSHGNVGVDAPSICDAAAGKSPGPGVINTPFSWTATGTYTDPSLQQTWIDHFSTRRLTLAQANNNSSTNTALYYDSVPDLNGFTPDGNLCIDFLTGGTSTSPGVDDCPIRFELQWGIECNLIDSNGNPTTQCQTCPTLLVGAKMIYKPSSTQTQSMNADEHGISPALRISLQAWCKPSTNQFPEGS